MGSGRSYCLTVIVILELLLPALSEVTLKVALTLPG